VDGQRGQDINDSGLEDLIEEKIKENRRGLPPKQTP
jgi:hypothetical protein